MHGGDGFGPSHRDQSAHAFGNEFLTDSNPSMIDPTRFWAAHLGEGVIADAFRWAHEADPQAKLFIHNNYDTGPLAPRSESTYDLVRKFRSRGVPIDGISLATHLLLDQLPRMQDEITNMNRLSALGLEMHVIEFEVSMPMPATAQNLQRQAAVYADYLNACLAIPSCKAFMIGP